MLAVVALDLLIAEHRLEKAGVLPHGVGRDGQSQHQRRRDQGGAHGLAAGAPDSISLILFDHVQYLLQGLVGGMERPEGPPYRVLFLHIILPPSEDF